MRGGAVGKGFQHVAETAFNDLGGDLENFLEDFFLKIGLVDPDASSAQFDTVENDVVVLPSDFFGLGLEKGCVLLHGCRKGVVGGHVAPFLLIVGHEGKVHDPKEFPVLGIAQDLPALLEQGGGLKPSSPQYVAGSISIPKGAIAAVGMSTQGTHTMFNNCLDYGLYHGIFVEKINTIGDLKNTIDKALRSEEKTLLIVIYNNKNQRRYIGVKLD